MSETLEIYQDNLKTIFSSITKSFESLIHCDSPSSKEEILNKLSYHINDCDKLIKTIDIQVSTGEDKDSNLTLYVQNYKNGLHQYKTKYLKEKEKVEFDKMSEKLEPKTIPISTTSPLTEEIAYKSFDKLEKAKRATYEMENSGNYIMIEMNSQTEKMKNTKTKITTLGNDLSDSTKLINEMDEHHKRNNKIIRLFFVGLFVAFLLIVFGRFYNNKTTTSTNATK